MWNSLEGAFDFAVAEAHAREGSKGLCTRIGNGGGDGAAIGSAVCMGELQLQGRRARDDELAVMDVVVRCAEGHEVLGGVRSVL